VRVATSTIAKKTNPGLLPMSSEILSQTDIDALIGGGAAGIARAAAPAAPAQDERQVELYDFRRPHRVSKDRLRTLEAMYERLVKSFEGWLMGRVRGQVELTLQGVEQLSFSEFTLSLATPCCAYLVDIRDSGGQQGVIDFGADFSFFLVDRLLGGRGVSPPPARGLTPIERMVVRTVADRLTSGVMEIWEDYIQLDLGVAGFESVPEILRATSGAAPVLVGTILVSANGRESVISLCLPFNVLDSFFADAGLHRRASVTGSESERRSSQRLVEGSLRGTRLPVTVRLPEFRISVRALTSLQPGSVLSTGLRRASEMEVLVSGRRRYLAKPARIGRRLAVSITESLAITPAAAEELDAALAINPFDEEL
jgi:flagellar motor switch protein FliM